MGQLPTCQTDQKLFEKSILNFEGLSGAMGNTTVGKFLVRAMPFCITVAETERATGQQPQLEVNPEEKKIAKRDEKRPEWTIAGGEG